MSYRFCVLLRTVDTRPGQTNSMGAWTMLLTVVEGLTVLRQLEEATKLYSLVLEAIETGALVRPFADGLLQTVAGMAAAAGGHWEKAEEHYRTALRQAHEIPHNIEQPEVRRWYARMLIDRDGLSIYDLEEDGTVGPDGP